MIIIIVILLIIVKFFGGPSPIEFYQKVKSFLFVNNDQFNFRRLDDETL